MPLRRLWLLLPLTLVSVFCTASVQSKSLWSSGAHEPLAVHERQLWISAVHDSEYSAVPHALARASCEATRQPEALATPNPLLDATDTEAKVTVSFIIGTDGRVHSPLIMESAGPSEDRTVLDAVRSWRYRPALCNGVPTEAEARIEFSSR